MVVVALGVAAVADTHEGALGHCVISRPSHFWGSYPHGEGGDGRSPGRHGCGACLLGLYGGRAGRGLRRGA